MLLIVSFLSGVISGGSVRSSNSPSNFTGARQESFIDIGTVCEYASLRILAGSFILSF